MAEETSGAQQHLRELKREFDEEFDDALADVTATLDEVSRVIAIPIPGLEPSSDVGGADRAESRDVPAASAPVVRSEVSPSQERFDLSPPDPSGSTADGDPITAFAPASDIDWGPRRLNLTHREHDAEEEDSN